jgi:hypothetical protein
MVEFLDTRCTTESMNWFAYAWTGSPSSPSQSFALSNGVQRTTSTPKCTIRFGTQPADAFVDSTITGEPLASLSTDVVTVELLQDGSVATGATDIVEVVSACAATADTAAVDGVASLSALKATSADPACVLTASAVGYGTVDSTPFKVLEPTGVLNCGDSETAPEEEGVTGTLTRLDTQDCTLLDYSLDFDGQTLVFLADYSVLEEGEFPEFRFDMAWAPEFVEVPLHVAVPYTEGGDNPPPATNSGFSTFVQKVPLTVQWFEDPDNRFFLDYCPAKSISYDRPPNDDNVVGIVLQDEVESDVDNDMSVLDGFQYGCLIKRTVEIVNDDVGVCPITALGDPKFTGPTTAEAICVKVTESFYVRGDFGATRTLR